MARDFLKFLDKFLGRYAAQAARKGVAVGGLGIILVASFWPLSPIQQAILDVGAKPEDAQAHFELAKAAAKAYDYDLAEREYQQVLGARDEIFPEEAIKEEIAEWEKIAAKINSRDVWLKLALLKWRIMDEGGAKEAWQRAWWIDPNSAAVGTVAAVVIQP